MPNVREPIKKTSIAKKQKIIEKGFELMCKKGYHHINCVDIAKYADVSTGSIYQYFSNKKDILIAGMNEYLNKIMFPVINKDKKQSKQEIIEELINSSIKNHKKYKVQHEELVGIVHQEKELSKIYEESEWKITKDVVSYFEKNNIHLTNALEKIHIVLGLIDNLAHELVYHHHEDINEEILIKETKEIINNIIKEK